MPDRYQHAPCTVVRGPRRRQAKRPPHHLQDPARRVSRARFEVARSDNRAPHGAGGDARAIGKRGTRQAAPRLRGAAARSSHDEYEPDGKAGAARPGWNLAVLPHSRFTLADLEKALVAGIGGRLDEDVEPACYQERANDLNYPHSRPPVAVRI